jgi:hypothetical protein
MSRESVQDSAVSYHLSSSPWPHSGKSTPVQKGLLLSMNHSDAVLCEEGVGFGVPILQYKRDFYFPGKSTVSKEGRIENHQAWKRFTMNLIDRRQRKVSSKAGMFTWVGQRIYNRIYKTSFGRRVSLLLINRFAPNISENYSFAYFEVESKGSILSSYSIDYDSNVIAIELDLSGAQTSGLQHIYVSNELGGTFFDVYADSSGLTLQGDSIEGWDKIYATWAEFQSPSMNIAFRVDIPKGVEAFRGREIIGRHICWSGVILKMPPSSKRVRYKVTIRPDLDGVIES